MKNSLFVLFSALFFLVACQSSPLEGRYYTQNNMLEISSLPSERFAFQILSSSSRKTKYVSGKAILVDKNQYYYEGENQKLIFDFEDNYVKITQITNEKSNTFKHFEGTYLYINPSKLHEPLDNVMRVNLQH